MKYRCIPTDDILIIHVCTTYTRNVRLRGFVYDYVALTAQLKLFPSNTTVNTHLLSSLLFSYAIYNSKYYYKYITEKNTTIYSTKNK